MTTRFLLTICYTPILWFAHANLMATASPTAVDCIVVNVRPYSANPEVPGYGLHVRLYNACSKDVMAIETSTSVDDRALSPSGFSVDFLASTLLKAYNPGAHPLRVGTEYEFDEQMEVPTTQGRVGTVSINAVIFSDGSAEGIPAGVARLFAIRRENAAYYEKQVKNLQFLLEHLDRDGEVSADALKHVDRDNTVDEIIQLDPLKRSNYITEKISEMQRLISLFHSSERPTVRSKGNSGTDPAFGRRGVSSFA